MTYIKKVAHMCNCVECVGFQPEPVISSGSNGGFVVMYMSEVLTLEHETESKAWEEFDKLSGMEEGAAK